MPPEPSETSEQTAGEATPTREKLLAAAYELLVDEGYHAATVQSIARRANLTSGAIYANFTNKHELLVLAVLRRWISSQGSPQLEGLDELQGSEVLEEREGPSGEGLTGLLVRHLSSPPAPEHRLLTEVTGAALRDPAAESLLRFGVEQVAALARTSIEERKAAGAMDERLPTDAMVALTVNQYLGAITSKSFDLPQPSATDVLDILDVFTSGAGDGRQEH